MGKHFARSAPTDLAVGVLMFVLIFVDGFQVSGCIVVVSELDSRDCLREVLRGEAFGVAGSFRAILTSKSALSANARAQISHDR